MLLIRKLISPFNVQAGKTAKENTKNLSNLSNSQLDSKTLDEKELKLQP